MVVCPECRNDNPEESKFCTRCGHSLTTTDSTIRRSVRREGAEDGIDMPAPKPPNPLFAMVAIIVVGLTALTVGTWWLLRPNPCEGKLASPRFPYCLQIPEEWERARATFEEQPADAYQPPTGTPLILVFAEQVEPGTDTSSYARTKRELLSTIGIFPSPMEQTEVGGEDAFTWEWTTTGENGAPRHSTQIVLVRGQIGWAIHFAGDDESYTQDQDLFQQVLRSWSFT